MYRPRHAVTLIEMLVATSIFMIGFVGIFSLFLVGVRFRKQSDDLVRLSLAASSLAEEFRIDAGREGTGTPLPPSDYVGDGFAANGPETAADDWFQYRMQPGIWYRVLSSRDIENTNSEFTPSLTIDLVTLAYSTGTTTLTSTELVKRLQIEDASGDLLIAPGQVVDDTLASDVADALVKHGFALRQTLVIIRHPSWKN